MLYRLLFAAVFRRMDPERAHRLGFGAIRAAAAVPGVARVLRSSCGPRDPALSVRALGLDFPGPFGLAAGFDKNAVGIDGLAALGFAFVEVGTVTARPQPGNPAPRLFRLPRDRALVNRMGFNNDGAEAVAARLTRWRERQRRQGRTRGAGSPIVGINLGKSKVVPEDEAIADYETSARLLAPLADYLVVNVSSPNTPGLRNLQAVSVLRPLLLAVRAAADEAAGRRVPLLVKIAPDLADQDIDAVADLAVEIGLDGIVATNTTIRRDGLSTPSPEVEALGAGGLSGPVLRERALEVLRRLRARVGDEMTIVGVGGITTADAAAERLAAGATLLQGYTGFVYEGPFWAARIHRGLSRSGWIQPGPRRHDASSPETGRNQSSGPGRREENASR
ncbi:quinone-dependent dihydroorotate dehydrogenase [Actinocrinis sp.]|uniref:quinone-dependent dihydroorotate dehydrogenase n=1 Tax=Actinocrinis sp. TaxID=1920516 RepID=UPI002D222F23|nr:quinone-dependent dihydroorotate dehydrogenase [Actinocrinis sp.]HZP53052.1 quinone-dependent dihydroorotate dehydrogenase [Actinocrinis sp.]